MVATARKLESLAKLAESGVMCEAMDVTSDDSVTAAMKEVLAKVGRVDVLINNAGVSRVGPVAEQKLSEIRDVLETNVLGVVRVTQAVVPSMAAKGAGLIVNIGSITSQLTTPWSAAYSASKSALRSISTAMSLELAPFGVHVTYVMAGSIRWVHFLLPLSTYLLNSLELAGNAITQCCESVPSRRSSFADNSVAAMDMSAYSKPSSMYRQWVESIANRARMSQSGPCMEAEDAARQIGKVIEAALKCSGKQGPPPWFLAGAQALYYWVLGFFQMNFGWPVNGMLKKKFHLEALPAN